MKKVMHGLLFSLTLFSVQSNADSPYLDGEFTVSGGQANYNVSLELPKGRAGYTPSLAIAYNSNGANNELGLGWQIEGKSTIARCARTLSTDGQWGGVKFDDNDRYCVNGKRLIAITGKDGAHLTEYRTEVDDGNKYVSFNKVGSGPEYFKVWTPDGEEHTYGGTADSKLVLAGNVLSWDISQDRDSSNNLINYTYLTDNNIKYLSAVNYVGGKVHFNYVDRKDYVTKYFLGYKQIRKKRLNDITISNNYNQIVNKYTLSYKYADTSGLSLITAISKSISGYEITPIKMHWSYMPSSTGPSVNHILNVANPILYDKERDGVFETVSYSNHQTLGIWGNEGLTTLKNCDSSTGCYAADNNGDGINNLSKSRLYDMNGDGKTDGSGYGNVLDINNDGLMDSYTYLSGREDWTGCGKHECQKWLNYSSLNVNLQNSQLNLLYYCSTSGGNCRYSDYLYHSSKFKDVAFYDMNNDGYKDILFKLYDAPNYRIMINNGNRFEAPVELSNTANLISQVLDINHDGINELILKDRHGRDHQIVYLTPEINKVKTVKHYNGNAYYADVNSDGIYEKITVNDNKYTSIIRFTPNVFHVDTIETYADKIDISYAAISNKNPPPLTWDLAPTYS